MQATASSAALAGGTKGSRSLVGAIERLVSRIPAKAIACTGAIAAYAVVAAAAVSPRLAAIAAVPAIAVLALAMVKFNQMGKEAAK